MTNNTGSMQEMLEKLCEEMKQWTPEQRLELANSLRKHSGLPQQAAWVGTLRRIARQAVIFMLVAAVLAFVATLIYQSVEHHEAQKTYDLAVQAGYGGDAHPPESLIDILGESMIASAGGCLAGLVLWAFYRVVLFAIRG